MNHCAIGTSFQGNEEYEDIQFLGVDMVREMRNNTRKVKVKMESKMNEKKINLDCDENQDSIADQVCFLVITITTTTIATLNRLL
jgi:hypothetical protein